MASVPPAKTISCRPQRISLRAESRACRPEPQLRCTVHAGTWLPQPNRKPTTGQYWPQTLVA